jgi:hypothetical protein
VGQSLGVAVIGATIAAGLHTAGWWIMTFCGGAVLLLGILTSGRWAAGTAERAAERLVAESPRVPVSAP